MCKVINDKENMTRILLVDDEKDTEYAFALILKAEGYIVDAYNDPVKALLAFKPAYYDLIILDYRMAPLDGLALIQKIRAIDGWLSRYYLLRGKHDILERRSENGS